MVLTQENHPRIPCMVLADSYSLSEREGRGQEKAHVEYPVLDVATINGVWQLRS